jgi:hypothetical protein
MTDKFTDTETKKQIEQLLITLDHKTKAFWAADCARHVLALFEDRYPGDDRPRKAIKAALAWAMGQLKMTDARKYALAAHAAAREAGQAAGAAARAAGHAAATAHVADHALHAAGYAAKAAAFASDSADTEAAARERTWQLERLMQYAREESDGHI